MSLRYRHALAAQGDGPKATSRTAGQPAKAAAVESASSIRRDPRAARVEAVLFVANEPLGSRKIGQFASLADGTEARTLIRRLNRYYDSQDSAFRIEEIAGGFQMLTRPKFGGWLRRLHQAPVETRLSAPAMETLAVVAYRQVVPRAEIEAVRGVQCGEMLRQLMERDLVRIVGRANDLGRPFLYGTTTRFLQLFGLRHLDELPRADVLRRARGGATHDDARHETNPVAGRGAELTTSDSNEESEVSIVANPEPVREDLWKLGAVVTLTGPKAEADEDDDLDDDDWDDDEEDEEDDLDDEEEDDLDDDDDLEDDEWEEVDDDEEWDDDDDEDEEDDDWDDDDDDEEDDEDDDWEDEE